MRSRRRKETRRSTEGLIKITKAVALNLRFPSRTITAYPRTAHDVLDMWRNKKHAIKESITTLYTCSDLPSDSDRPVSTASFLINISLVVESRRGQLVVEMWNVAECVSAETRRGVKRESHTL